MSPESSMNPDAPLDPEAGDPAAPFVPTAPPPGTASPDLAETVRTEAWTPSFTTGGVLNVDGTTSTHYPDGTQDVRAPDGTCWRLAPTGAVVHAWQEPPVPQWHPPHAVAARQPDGGTVVYHPDGSKELWQGGAQVARFDPGGQPAD